MLSILMCHIVLGRSLMELKWLDDRFAFESRSTQVNKIGFSDVRRWESLYILCSMDTKTEVELFHRAGTVISVYLQHI